MPSPLTGKVTWFNEAKGYGEIVTLSGEVFFFTYSELHTRGSFKKISRDTQVEFQPDGRLVFGSRVATSIRPTKRKAATISTREADVAL